jgi:hypothetical protein
VVNVNKKVIKTSVIALALTLGVGATAYASTKTANINNQRPGLHRFLNIKGYEVLSDMLKEKFGLTDKQITDSLNQGKSYYDIAKEKGMSIDQFKKAALTEKEEVIDKAVKDGTLTEKTADDLKNKIEQNVENCNGTCMQGHGKSYRGSGNHVRANNNCMYNTTSSPSN